jgi:hypothetical protein
MLSGMVWGVVLWALSAAATAAATGAASGGASALGAVLADALTNGKDSDSSARHMIVAGTIRGAIAGASYTLILICGAMIFGLD